MGRAYQNRKDSMAKTSDAKAKVYSKYGREIYVCAKAGGIDPDGNLTLRGLIDKAKKDQVPTHVIDKAIEKAKGGAGEDFETARYEGFGPGGCMVIVDCLTDNSTRTFNDVRLCFTKNNCKIGTQGSVSHMFEHSSILAFHGQDEEKVFETLIDANIEITDIEAENDLITVFTPQSEYGKVKKTLADFSENIEFEVDEIQFIPNSQIKINPEEMEVLNKFLMMLNDLDDVQRVYHNVEE